MAAGCPLREAYQEGTALMRHSPSRELFPPMAAAAREGLWLLAISTDFAIVSCILVHFLSFSLPPSEL